MTGGRTAAPRRAALLLALLLAAGFLVFVWPTPYTVHVVDRGHYKVTVRVNRFTGTTDQLTTAGWR